MGKKNLLRKRGFGAAPFWAWNDELNPDELRRQVRDFAARGIGGVYIHSREGLETPYLGERWMEAVKLSVAEAEAVGLDVWLYDEDRWPSGFAGGKAPRRGEAYGAKALSIEPSARTLPPDALAAYAVVLGQGDRASSVRRVLIPQGGDNSAAASILISPEETLVVLRRELILPCEWFNGEAPPDDLNPDCVDAFLEETHEAYFKILGDQFGKTVRGFFFDEPGVHDRHATLRSGRGWIPWTDGFSDYFLQRRGYDFFDVAPYLFFEAQDARAARHDYWRTLSERFRETFSGRIGRWCRSHGVLSSGHLLWEGDLGVSTRVCGAIMPNDYEQELPGIDILGISDQEVSTVKQCASVVNQFDKVGLVSEMYGTAGWNLSFEDQKRHGDWQAVLGVTLRCQHHALYSIRGSRKRDYPPSFNYQSCWWPELKVVEDYFSRINAALDGTVPVRDILVIHPVSSAWARIGSSPRGFPSRNEDRDLPAVKQYGDEFNAILRFLVEEKRDCDIGDETLMAEQGGVDGSSLRIGRACYGTVILPNLDTVLPTTLSLLKAFVEGRGQLIVLGKVPDAVEARPSEEASAFFGGPSVNRVDDPSALAALLDATLPRQLDILGGDGRRARSLWARLGDREGSSVVFVSNRDAQASIQGELRIRRTGRVSELDPLSGETRSVVATSNADGDLIVRTEFGPSGSRLFIIDPCSEDQRSLVPASSPRLMEHGRLISPSAVTLPMANALPLDRACVKVADGPWSAEAQVWEVQDQARALLGYEGIAASEGIQRYLWVHQRGVRDGTPVSFRTSFVVDVLPQVPIFLALEERRDVLSITLNGVPASLGSSGFYVDRSMELSALPSPRLGVNELEISYAYRNATEVEDCYIVGDFGVDAERRIGAPVTALKLGDWTNQGLYHYPGSVIYGFDVTIRMYSGCRYFVDPGDYRGTTATISVNGRRSGPHPWRSVGPVEVTELVMDGNNLMEVEVFGGGRNLFGPFHCQGWEGPSVNWGHFRLSGGAFNPGYSVNQCGLYGPVRVLVSGAEEFEAP